jgi:hypothetical protein
MVEREGVVGESDGGVTSESTSLVLFLSGFKCSYDQCSLGTGAGGGDTYEMVKSWNSFGYELWSAKGIPLPRGWSASLGPFARDTSTSDPVLSNSPSSWETSATFCLFRGRPIGFWME